MPVNHSFTRDMLIESAFKLVRAEGIEKLSARTLAKKLNCSTQPLYSNFKSMKKLDMELRKMAAGVQAAYQTKSRTGQVLLDMGLGYILFARKEKNLFRFLYGENNRGKNGGYGKTLRKLAFEHALQRMKNESILEGLSEQQRESVLTKMWIFVHGIAFLSINNAFSKGNDEYIEEILRETQLSIIEGERSKNVRV